MSWSTAYAELNESIADVFGESLSYVSLDGLTTATISEGVMYRDGEDGQAKFDFPTASVASPAFGDSLTDGDGVVWRVYEVLQKDSALTPVMLRRSTQWHAIDSQSYDPNTDAWANVTTGIYAHIEQTDGTEVIAAEDGHAANAFDVRTQYLTTVTDRMRLKWGSRYLYVAGTVQDPDQNFTTFKCVELEA